MAGHLHDVVLSTEESTRPFIFLRALNVRSFANTNILSSNSTFIPKGVYNLKRLLRFAERTQYRSPTSILTGSEGKLLALLE